MTQLSTDEILIEDLAHIKRQIKTNNKWGAIFRWMPIFIGAFACFDAGWHEAWGGCLFLSAGFSECLRSSNWQHRNTVTKAKLALRDRYWQERLDKAGDEI
jgi:hypothetical protein